MYSLVTCINGNYKIEAEGLTGQSSRVLFHQKCAAFWNAQDVITGQVSVLDEQLNVVYGMSEYITHEPQEQGE